MSDVFITHVEEDADVAFEIALGLEVAGYTTWCYELDCIPGSSYLIQTGRAIEQSEVVVLVISPHSISSRQVTKEVVRAHESDKHFLPVLRDITHIEFQNGQPEWREAVGAATSVRIPSEGVAGILARVIDGLKALDIHPRAKPDPARIDRIRKELAELQARSIKEKGRKPREQGDRRREAVESIAIESPAPVMKAELEFPAPLRRRIASNRWFWAGGIFLFIGLGPLIFMILGALQASYDALEWSIFGVISVVPVTAGVYCIIRGVRAHGSSVGRRV